MQDPNPAAVGACDRPFPLLAFWGRSGLRRWGPSAEEVLGGAKSLPFPSSSFPFSLHRVAMPVCSCGTQPRRSAGAPGSQQRGGADTDCAADVHRDWGQSAQKGMPPEAGTSSGTASTSWGVSAHRCGLGWHLICPWQCSCVSVPTLLLFISSGCCHCYIMSALRPGLVGKLLSSDVSGMS